MHFSFASLQCVAVCVTLLASGSTALSTISTPSVFSKHFPEAKTAASKKELVLTYLEMNGFLMTTAGVTILIDPILEGPLDFGIPDLYTGQKKTLPSSGLCESLPPIDCLLITQGLDDHAHIKTLKKLAADPSFADVPIVAPPSAEGALKSSGMYRPENVRILRHGQRTTVQSKHLTASSNDDDTIMIQATTGALPGPPWQTRENGYLLRPSPASEAPSIYIEPHVEFKVDELRKEAPVDVVITPIVGQRLPIMDLVYGPDNAVKLVETLLPKVVVPMPNSNVAQSGAISFLVSQIGSESDFFQKLQASKAAGTEVKHIVPGKDELIQIQ